MVESPYSHFFVSLFRTDVIVGRCLKTPKRIERQTVATTPEIEVLLMAKEVSIMDIFRGKRLPISPPHF